MTIFKNLKSVVQLYDKETKEPISMPEVKPYLLILLDNSTYLNGDEDFREGQWVSIRGRQAIFDYLVSNMGNYDMLHSFVLTGKIKLGQEISVYSFMRSLIQGNKVENTGNITIDELNDLAKECALNNEEEVDLNLLFVEETNRIVG